MVVSDASDRTASCSSGSDDTFTTRPVGGGSSGAAVDGIAAARRIPIARMYAAVSIRRTAIERATLRMSRLTLIDAEQVVLRIPEAQHVQRLPNRQLEQVREIEVAERGEIVQISERGFVKPLAREEFIQLTPRVHPVPNGERVLFVSAPGKTLQRMMQAERH